MANLLKRNKEINFDQSQFLFIIPIEWRDKGLECSLRSLFLESNWITKDDHRNHLIFLPFLDCYINYLRNSRLSSWHKEFKREGKYLLYSMVPNTETGGIIFGITCFQMQNAKELSAVSRKLASGDLLLIPTILHSKTIELPSLKDVVKPIIIKNAEKKSNECKTTTKIEKCNIRGIQHKRNCLSISTEIISKKIGCARDTILFKTNEIAGVYDDEFITMAAKEIASKLLKTYKLIRVGRKNNAVYKRILNKPKLKLYLRDLGIGDLLAAICNDPKIQLPLADIYNAINEVLFKFSPIKNAPDGIQNIIIHDSAAFGENDSEHPFYKYIINDFLVNTNVDEIRNYHEHKVMAGHYITFGAMQKPYTMIQIANSFLPPTILNDKYPVNDSSKQIRNTTLNDRKKIDLLPPNSFYVHARVKDLSVCYILNKIIKASPSISTSEKSTFTVKEKTICMDSTIDSACDHLLNHLQMLSFDGNKNTLLQRCYQHQLEDGLSMINYNRFLNNMKQLVKALILNEIKPSENEPNAYQPILIKISCGCAIQVSHEMILEIGLKPAISNIATLIASSLADNDLFGLYNVSSLIITGVCEKSESIYQRYRNRLVREKMYTFLQKHKKKPVVFFSFEEMKTCMFLGSWAFGVSQILEKGNYTQISSTSYIIEFTVRTGPNNRIYEYDGKSHRILSQNNLKLNTYSFLALKQGDILGKKILYKKFVFRDCIVKYIRLFALDNSQNGKTRILLQDYARSTSLDLEEYFYASSKIDVLPLTLGIIAQNHSSSVHFELSFTSSLLETENRIVNYERSFKVHERLTLQKQSLGIVS